ncbi:unnamed protein product [Hymenolepis diminuta]|uniref:Uncharacterized protein n=1 Tax=Hymenolepis diminuta TaxID=6216 RepID=A0A564Y9D3_HYMDI|nr:unnamed protein product [Hymenolepis diminuta]
MTYTSNINAVFELIFFFHFAKPFMCLLFLSGLREFYQTNISCRILRKMEACDKIISGTTVTSCFRVA